MSSPPHTPALQGRAPCPPWCSWLRRFLHSSTPVLLDTATRGWQCPRPRWESPNPALETDSTEIPSVLGPQKYPPRVTPVQIASWKFSCLSSASHPKQRQDLWRLEIEILQGISPHVLPCPLGTQVGVFLWVTWSISRSHCVSSPVSVTTRGSEPCCQGVPATSMVFLHPL